MQRTTPTHPPPLPRASGLYSRQPPQRRRAWGRRRRSARASHSASPCHFYEYPASQPSRPPGKLGIRFPQRALPVRCGRMIIPVRCFTCGKVCRPEATCDTGCVEGKVGGGGIAPEKWHQALSNRMHADAQAWLVPQTANRVAVEVVQAVNRCQSGPLGGRRATESAVPG